LESEQAPFFFFFPRPEIDFLLFFFLSSFLLFFSSSSDTFGKSSTGFDSAFDGGNEAKKLPHQVRAILDDLKSGLTLWLFFSVAGRLE